MKVEFRKEFVANFRGIRSRDLADEIEHIIDVAEEIEDIYQIPGIKKLKGYSDYFRIRIEDYRVGTKLSGDTIIFVCLYHRSVVYKLFP